MTSPRQSKASFNTEFLDENQGSNKTSNELSILFQGKTFSRMIADFVQIYGPLNETYLSVYETPRGRAVYEETLACVREQYPQYVREIEGTADGSGVPFYKVSPSVTVTNRSLASVHRSLNFSANHSRKSLGRTVSNFYAFSDNVPRYLENVKRSIIIIHD